MVINRIVPQGFCKGVVLALKMAYEAKSEKKTYCLGSLIHNSIMVKRLEDSGIITINDKNKSRMELLDMIPDGSRIIISAHGASPSVFKKAQEKGLEIIDATCEYVYKTHSEIKKHLDLGYDVYYIGSKGHAECEGAIGIDSRIHLISSLTDIDSYTFKDKSFIINQTTMSIYDIEKFHKKIKEKNENVLFSNSICMATTQRQKAVIEASPCDLFIVVGDSESSNTKKLYALASEKSNAIMINSLSDIDDAVFEGVNTINITSGASTPRELVDSIIEYINKK